MILVEVFAIQYDLGTAFFRRVKNRKCVDTILRDDAAILTDMVDATVNLLEQARYDIGGYQAWLQGEGAMT